MLTPDLIGGDMNNLTALILAFVVTAIFIGDQVFGGGQLPVFIGKQFLSMVNYVIFWR